ncbi:hypothetical protein SynSYN20_02484 [Synechococcus sp. SYN20]|nr:hypothetical protein SynSYN20_02484 [Synechococcus sp. SYN20]
MIYCAKDALLVLLLPAAVGSFSFVALSPSLHSSVTSLFNRLYGYVTSKPLIFNGLIASTFDHELLSIRHIPNHLAVVSDQDALASPAS